MSISMKDYDHPQAHGLDETIEALEALLQMLKTRNITRCESIGTVEYYRKEYKYGATSISYVNE